MNNNNENIDILNIKPKTSKIEVNKPLIFVKKSNAISRVIPLNGMRSDFGVIRHFPPAAQE
jgi:hypothetical protein